MKNIEMYQEKYFNNLEEIFNTQTYFLRNRVINVFDLVGHVKGKKILDIGTANGLFAIESAKKGATSIGLDFSKVALRNARKNTSNSLTNVEFVCAECSTLPFKSNIFDILILADLVEHLDQNLYNKLIEECWRILKKGGLIAIYTPNREHIFDQLRKRNIILSRFNEHTNLMNMDEVITVLKKNNFSIEKSYYRNSHIPVFNKVESLINHIPKYKKFFMRRINVLGMKI
jgi:2-polyprenyl-3-methyl-5-hydroxy-6-metoxy-1,4-benzoquinol methylase